MHRGKAASTSADKRILGESEYKTGKLDSPSPLAQPPKCPECGSQRIWKDGVRYTNEGNIQRWLCRNCGYRFSEPTVKLNIFRKRVSETFDSGSQLFKNRIVSRQFAFKESFNSLPFTFSEDVVSHKLTTVGKQLNTLPYNSCKRQVCVSEREAKNLATVKTRFGEAQRESTTLSADLKGMLVNYEAKLILKGLDPKTIQRRITMLKLLNNRGANLLKPESVFQAIDHAKKWDWKTRQTTEDGWSEGSKNNAAQAYLSLCELLKIPILEGVNFGKWGRQPQKIPWVPLETEIDQLIAGSLLLVATFLQLLKETGMRCGEAIRLTWIDIDTEHGVLTVNKPEKHSLPRQFKISGKLVAMLNRLPKQRDKVFHVDLRTMRKRFMWQRNRIASKVENPRLKRITFHTLRHWFGTMEYHKTKDILHVQERLGHRSITSTLIYTHLVNFESDEYHTATSKSLKEDEDLLKAGFEYVTERDGVKIYRKRK